MYEFAPLAPQIWGEQSFQSPPKLGDLGGINMINKIKFIFQFSNATPNEQQMDCINTHLKNTNQEDIEVLEAVQRGQSSLGYEKSLFMIKPEAVEWDERIVYYMQQLTKKALNF